MELEIHNGMLQAQTMILASLIRRLHVVEAVDKDDMAVELRRLVAELPGSGAPIRYDVARIVYENLATLLEKDFPGSDVPEPPGQPGWTPIVLEGGKPPEEA